MMWAMNHNNEWIAESIENQIELINNNDSNFKPWLDKYKYFDRFPENNRKFYQEQCSAFLNEYNDMVSSTTFLFGESLMLADAAIFPFVRQFANVDYDWFKSKYDKLLLWLERICASDLFIVAMKKYDEWEKNNKSIIINN